MTEEQLPKVATTDPSPFDAENPTELDKQDNEEYLAAIELAKNEMA